MKKFDKEFHKFILFTVYPEGLKSLAWQLSNEGKDVTVGQVSDLKSIGLKHPEKTEEQRRRVAPYKNMLKIKKAEDLIDQMAKFENKDEYFVLFDSNMMWEFADKAKAMGYTYGLFPSKFDFRLEDDRQFAKEFVQLYYPDLKVAEVEEFKKIDEAIEFINGSDEFWALKGNDVYTPTVVPTSSDIEFVRSELIDALKSDQVDFERGGFILERQIRDGVEFCMEQIFYDGELVCSSVDIENKTFGSSNTGCKYGCAINLVCSVPNDAPINQKVFPEVVAKLAKKHKGIYLSDANTIMKDGELYFLEFCGNRFGIDAVQTECDMAGSVYNFLMSLVNKQNPFDNEYGVAVRGFNTHREKDFSIKEDNIIRWKKDAEKHIWPFEIYKDDKGNYLNTGSGIDLAVFTDSSNDLEYAIIKAYENVDKFSFNEMYYRSYGDFIDREYHANILDRYEAIKTLIESPEQEDGK